MIVILCVESTLRWLRLIDVFYVQSSRHARLACCFLFLWYVYGNAYCSTTFNFRIFVFFCGVLTVVYSLINFVSCIVYRLGSHLSRMRWMNLASSNLLIMPIQATQINFLVSPLSQDLKNYLKIAQQNFYKWTRYISACLHAYNDTHEKKKGKKKEEEHFIFKYINWLHIHYFFCTWFRFFK